MNQEKLSKLQNQVRIGGKVRLVANGYTVALSEFISSGGDAPLRNDVTDQ